MTPPADNLSTVGRTQYGTVFRKAVSARISRGLPYQAAVDVASLQLPESGDQQHDDGEEFQSPQ